MNIYNDEIPNQINDNFYAIRDHYKMKWGNEYYIVRGEFYIDENLFNYDLDDEYKIELNKGIEECNNILPILNRFREENKFFIEFVYFIIFNIF
jgi:hypothetical protein